MVWGRVCARRPLGGVGSVVGPGWPSPGRCCRPRTCRGLANGAGVGRRDRLAPAVPSGRGAPRPRSPTRDASSVSLGHLSLFTCLLVPSSITFERLSRFEQIHYKNGRRSLELHGKLCLGLGRRLEINDLMHVFHGQVRSVDLHEGGESLLLVGSSEAAPETSATASHLPAVAWGGCDLAGAEAAAAGGSAARSRLRGRRQARIQVLSGPKVPLFPPCRAGPGAEMSENLRGPSSSLSGQRPPGAGDVRAGRRAAQPPAPHAADLAPLCRPPRRSPGAPGRRL